MATGASQMSNDSDYVKYTKYSKKNGVLPDLARAPPPTWVPLPINNTELGHAHLPPHIDAGDPFAIFKLFFDDALLDAVACHTNDHAEKLRGEDPDPYLRPRPWKPTSPTELYTYLAIVLYMGIHKEPEIEEYWERGHKNAPIHQLNNYMAETRWQQIDRFIYCTQPGQRFRSPFGRVWDLSDHIRQRSLQYWIPGKHLCVDEAIARFTGRAREIVIIKSKPTPEGYKIWCLANDGVILNWLFHAKGIGRGPVNLNAHLPYMASTAHLTPTEQVPVNLVLGVNARGERLFEPGAHIVWDDNLFNTIPMLEYLRDYGVGGAGTVRTTTTTTEERFEAVAKSKASSGGPAARSRAKAKLLKERFNAELMSVKTRYTAQTEWGDIFWAVSNNNTVIQAAWRDAQVVLFASTVTDGKF